MIRINLLPRTSVKGAGPSIRNQAIVAGVVILLSLNGILFFPKFGYFPVTKEIADLNAKIEDQKKELEKVKKANDLLEEIKKKNNDIQAKLKIIDDIESKRTGPVWLMDEMTDAVSRFRVTDAQTGKESWQYVDDAGKVFLTKFEITGNAFAIEGLALNNTYLVAFLNNLKNKKALFIPESVTLYFSDQSTYEGAIVRSFKITATVNLGAKPVAGGVGAATDSTTPQTGSNTPGAATPPTAATPTSPTPTAQAKPK